MMKKIFYISFTIAAITYHLLPVDIVPDVIPVIGQIDDIIFYLIPIIIGAHSVFGKNKNQIQSGTENDKKNKND